MNRPLENICCTVLYRVFLIRLICEYKLVNSASLKQDGLERTINASIKC